LSVRLAAVGRREEGLAAIQDAVEVRRRLAEARPHIFLADLAEALNNQSNALVQLGRVDEALASKNEAERLLPMLDR
jgi:hypothetical protein